MLPFRDVVVSADFVLHFIMTSFSNIHHKLYQVLKSVKIKFCILEKEKRQTITMQIEL